MTLLLANSFFEYKTLKIILGASLLSKEYGEQSLLLYNTVF
jgi:hypothetical protein